MNPLSSQNLKAAQRVLVEYCWVKKTGNIRDGFCALGALAHVLAPHKFDFFNIVLTSPEYLILLEITAPLSLTEFNDKAEDKKEVIEVFNRAIQLAKLKERANVST